MSFDLTSEELSGVREVHVELLVLSESWDPEAISEHLELRPAGARWRGEPLDSGPPAPCHSWWCGTEDRLDSRSFAIHLEALLQTLEPRRAALLGPSFREAAQLRVFGFWLGLPGAGLSLPAQQLGRLAALRLPLHLDPFFEE